MTDDELLARLIEAATVAIESERPGLSYDRQRLKGVTIELSIGNGGSAIRGEVYLQRSANLRTLLAPGPAVPGD